MYEVGGYLQFWELFEVSVGKYAVEKLAYYKYTFFIKLGPIPIAKCGTFKQ